MIEQDVDMDALAFTANPHVVLVTLGVCTCIAFVIQGTYWDEELDEQISFCGLYHWSGFDVSNTPHDEQTQNAFNYFLDELRHSFALAKDSPVEIKNLQFIGGEKNIYNDNNELTFTATEAEVNSLIQTVQAYDFKKNYFNLDPSMIKHQHFLTSGDQSIQLELTTDQCKYTIDEGDNDLENTDTIDAIERFKWY